ncbi:MAG: tRNA lysidine(34) synthetase TilS [Rhodobacteraceae bacterium]|nr:tRNA lysidine(34) synthetase TilS [Paracoccaceae bacterium]
MLLSGTPLLAAAATALNDGAGPVGVAVSGGGDSLALLHLTLRAAAGSGRPVEAATVDHGLRPEAADEARQVARLCADWGVAHATLRWDAAAGPGNLMDRARHARIGLLAGWAAERGLSAVLLGHTADDVAETLLMGLAREAGIDGLTGPRPAFTARGIRFLRPLLAVSRAELRDYLTRQGLGWIDDPTNDDARFTRPRARAALAGLAPLGIRAAGLARVAGHLAQAQAALEAATATAARHLLQETAGAARLDRTAFAEVPEEIRRRLILGLLRGMTGTPHPPRETGLARVLAAIAAGRDASLGGLLLQCRGTLALVSREPRAVAGLEAAPGTPWDGRWRVTGPFAPGDRLRALGAAGRAACPGWRDSGLAARVLDVTPAVWRGDRLISAPLAPAGAADFAATCAPAFLARPLSH